MVTLLIENGADVNKSDEIGKTALYHAMEAGQHDIVELLIEKQEDLAEALK
jgi:ankyrin repeat protein